MLVLLALIPPIAVAEPPTAPPQPQRAEEQPATDDADSSAFTVQILDSNGLPIAGANVELRGNTKLEQADFIRGRQLKRGTYGQRVACDENGELTLPGAKLGQYVAINVTLPHYGPYWAEWRLNENSEPLPTRFTVKLEDAWTVGSRLVDEQGNPVVGATVRPSIKFKKRPGDNRELGIGTRVQTDSEGYWKFESVPATMADVHVTIDHDGFQPLRQSLPRDGFAVEKDEQPVASLTLARGVTLRGTVTDAENRPVEGATVRTKFLNEIREAKTDASGEYQIAGCEPRMARVVVSAAGKALELKEVRIADDMQPVDFVLQPGGHIRVEVIGADGNPVPKSRIFFQSWRGRIDYFEFDHVDDYTDEHGVWEWNEAPLDTFAADICPPGGMQLTERPLTAREEPYVFQSVPRLTVRGAVTDSESGEAVMRFRVRPALRNGSRINYMDREAYDAIDGKFEAQFDLAYSALLVRIEAPGYLVAESRDFRFDEGEVDYDFKLTPARPLKAVVQTPAGDLAVGAKVALGIAGSQIRIDNGDINDGSTYATRVDVGENGSFEFPAQRDPFQLVVTHPGGYAHLDSKDGLIPDRITLTEWARVKGTFRVGDAVQPNVKLELFGLGPENYATGQPHITCGYETITGKLGEFEFKNVFAGQGFIRRNILLMVDDGATEVTSSRRQYLETQPGEATQLEVGGDGFAVIGKLIPPKTHQGEVLWSFALLHAELDLVAPPQPRPPAAVQGNNAQELVWRQQWRNTPEGLAWRAAYAAFEQSRRQMPYFTVTVDREGSFRIDDVPPGTYKLSVRFSQHPAGQIRDYRFAVPGEAADDAAYDLGTLQLE
jgi:protocatechuate 3,4-dioxygenase beta subunit